MATLTIAPEKETTAMPQTIKTINYKEAMKKLQEIRELIDISEFIGGLGIALKAQLELINHLNDEVVSCPIAWDETTGFPSHPTLTADTQKYVDIFEPQDLLLATILRSFARWELLTRETSVRCCGSVYKLKTVTMDIQLNHVLKSEDGWLNFKQLVGVKSADLNHQELKDYFDFKQPSMVIDGLMIIFRREQQLRIKNGKLETGTINTVKAELFNLEKFQSMINPLGIQ